MKARPESMLARHERKRGIIAGSVPCPSLVVVGDEFRDERGRPVAELYGSDVIDFPGLDHWGLVLEAHVRDSIAGWLGLRE